MRLLNETMSRGKEGRKRDRIINKYIHAKRQHQQKEYQQQQQKKNPRATKDEKKDTWCLSRYLVLHQGPNIRAPRTYQYAQAL